MNQYIINTAFKLAQTVYIITDPDQLQRMITGYYIDVEGNVMYEVALSAFNSRHYAAELTADKNILALTQ